MPAESAGPSRRRTADEEALAKLDAELAQRLELLRGLDALGDHVEPEPAREGDDHADEARVAAVRAQPVDEGLGDLEAVERQRVQIAQRRVAGAEVVECDPDPERAQLGEAGGAR